MKKYIIILSILTVFLVGCSHTSSDNIKQPVKVVYVYPYASLYTWYNFNWQIKHHVINTRHNIKNQFHYKNRVTKNHIFNNGIK